MHPHTPSRKRSAKPSFISDQHQQPRSGKRRQCNSPYVSQGNASCSICLDKAVQLVQLGACGHTVCRGCMTSHLLHAFKLAQLPLCCPIPKCRARLGLQPAVQLMEQQVPGSKALAAQVLLAAADHLSLIPDHLCFACPYLDCQVPLELDTQLPDVPADCPACNRPVCGTCRSKWHGGLRCADYQALAGAGRPGSFSSSSGSFSSGTIQQPQQQPPLISAASDSSTMWQPAWLHNGSAQQQQQQQYRPLEQHNSNSDNISNQQQQQVAMPLLPPRSSVTTRGAAAAAAGWQVGSCGASSDGQCSSSSVALSDQDAMAWSPAKHSGV